MPTDDIDTLNMTSLDLQIAVSDDLCLDYLEVVNLPVLLSNVKLRVVIHTDTTRPINNTAEVQIFDTDTGRWPTVHYLMPAHINSGAAGVMDRVRGEIRLNHPIAEQASFFKADRDRLLLVAVGLLS
jgi:hypothetical protein